MVSRVVVRGGSFVPSPYIVQMWNDKTMIASGRYISDAEESNGEKVVIIPEDALDYYPELLNDNGTATIGGEDYTVIGTHTSFGVIVPLLSMPENAEIFNNLDFNFKNPVTKKQYNEFVKVAEEVCRECLLSRNRNLPTSKAFLSIGHL